MLTLLLVIAALVLGAVGGWLHSARLVGVGLVCLALAGLLPHVA